jgi:pyruvate,water dikinase
LHSKVLGGFIHLFDDMMCSVPAGALPALIDELATLAGEYFASLSVVAGSGYKVEMNLAAFYRQHLAPRIGGSHLDLLAGFDIPSDGGDGHAVETLDWARPPVPDGLPGTADRRHDAIVEARRVAEVAAVEALTSSPRQLRTFRRLLADAQHLVPIREEQARELTLPWRVLRQAVERIGEELVTLGTIDAIDDAFFLTRDEVVAALAGAPGRLDELVAGRRSDWAMSRRLRPPLFTGRMARFTALGFSLTARMLGAARSDRSLVSGVPAAAGRATGPVRVIHGSDEFDLLEPGEILVAPLTTPGWTPLFGRAAAVVTDIGSALSHASIVAREFGIPAIVGCGDATARLVTGMRVTVDGSRGTVETARRDRSG